VTKDVATDELQGIFPDEFYRRLENVIAQVDLPSSTVCVNPKDVMYGWGRKMKSANEILTWMKAHGYVLIPSERELFIDWFITSRSHDVDEFYKEWMNMSKNLGDINITKDREHYWIHCKCGTDSPVFPIEIGTSPYSCANSKCPNSKEVFDIKWEWMNMNEKELAELNCILTDIQARNENYKNVMAFYNDWFIQRSIGTNGINMDKVLLQIEDEKKESLAKLIDFIDEYAEQKRRDTYVEMN
jgi:hypothetical protein